ncbi:MAG: CDP-alcohol phosphatidyltransferase family protein [bacterium]|nr:CDP-alcohol phosphatidyltransferase family protein [bacterium]
MPLPFFLREFWLWIIGPAERFFIRHGIKPNTITGASFFLSLVAGYLYYRGLFGFAGLTLIVAGTCDMFDGRVARATKNETQSGAFFDSTLDRFSEAFTFMGIMGFYRNSWVFWVAFLAFTGSMMISYTRARSETLKMEIYIGFMQRPERVFLISGSSVFSPIFIWFYHKWLGTEQHFLIFIIILIAISTNYVVFKRIKLILEKYNNPI